MFIHGYEILSSGTLVECAQVAQQLFALATDFGNAAAADGTERTVHIADDRHRFVLAAELMNHDARTGVCSGCTSVEDKRQCLAQIFCAECHSMGADNHPMYCIINVCVDMGSR